MCLQCYFCDIIISFAWLKNSSPIYSNQDGRLRTGDHILRIGATPTSGLTSDQVVKVLQGCGSHVTMLIARDPLGQRQTGPPPPPPPDSAPVSSLSPHPPELPVQRPVTTPQRRVSKTVSGCNDIL